MKTKSRIPETFRTLLTRINAAKNQEALVHCGKQITRHYDNNTITARELARLDVRIMERLAALEDY